MYRKSGDIVIWGTKLNRTGHIAIATGEGNTSKFYSYDQNWNGKAMHKVQHTYKGFEGVLRPKLEYQVHVQDIGWQDWKYGGETAGTTGQEKRIEAIIIKYPNIKYRVHIEDLGWSNWCNSGEVAGTTGQSKRIEAIQIQAPLELEARGHIQDIGWRDYKGYDITIGTTGQAKRLEAVIIK